MEIKGRTAVVTGAAAGIGRASALAIADRDAAKLILCDVDTVGMAEAAEVVRSKGAAVATYAIDLSDIEAMQHWLAELEAGGGYDILYSNAGIVSGVPQFPEAPVAKLRAIIDINLTAPIVACQFAAQAMRKRGGGVIVNTVSTVVMTNGFRDAMYAATKSGLMHFIRSCGPLKDEWNVRVAGVLPGLTDTPILKKTGGDDYAPWMAPVLANNEKLAPSDIADAVIDLIEDDSLIGGDWVAVRKVEGGIARTWGHDVETRI